MSATERASKASKQCGVSKLVSAACKLANGPANGFVLRSQFLPLLIYHTMAHDNSGQRENVGPMLFQEHRGNSQQTRVLTQRIRQKENKHCRVSNWLSGAWCKQESSPIHAVRMGVVLTHCAVVVNSKRKKKEKETASIHSGSKRARLGRSCAAKTARKTLKV